MAIQRLTVPSVDGRERIVRLDAPGSEIRGFALFAHCFACSGDAAAARTIAAELVRLGVAVLRFDFTGIGAGEEEFANDGPPADVEDLVAAADYLRRHFEAPVLLIGHSLAGAAVLAAAHRIPEAKAVVTLGAPSDIGHFLDRRGTSLREVEENGEGEVTIRGRSFCVGRSLADAVEPAELLDCAGSLRTALLIMHSPIDEVVGIDSASRIFGAARHPKSFISLDRADHLLLRQEDAAFAGTVIAGWTGRYLSGDRPQGEAPVEHVRVTETRAARYQVTVHAGAHRMFADEPVSAGGLDSGPSPYDLLSAALGACTAMTIRIYADFKNIDLGPISVDVSHEKMHAKDCADCAPEIREGGGKIDTFSRVISVGGGIPPELADKIVEIASKCPVHRTLESTSHIRTRLAADVARA